MRTRVPMQVDERTEDTITRAIKTAAANECGLRRLVLMSICQSIYLSIRLSLRLAFYIFLSLSSYFCLSTKLQEIPILIEKNMHQ